MAADEPAPSSGTWTALDRLGEHQTTVLGAARDRDEGGQGGPVRRQGDALFLDANPLAGLKQFTVEVVFQPQADGPKEQRFLHFQEAGSENRLLFETRLTDDGRWFLDTYRQVRRERRHALRQGIAARDRPLVSRRRRRRWQDNAALRQRQGRAESGSLV